MNSANQRLAPERAAGGRRVIRISYTGPDALARAASAGAPTPGNPVRRVEMRDHQVVLPGPRLCGRSFINGLEYLLLDHPRRVVRPVQCDVAIAEPTRQQRLHEKRPASAILVTVGDSFTQPKPVVYMKRPLSAQVISRRGLDRPAAGAPAGAARASALRAVSTSQGEKALLPPAGLAARDDGQTLFPDTLDASISSQLSLTTTAYLSTYCSDPRVIASMAAERNLGILNSTVRVGDSSIRDVNKSLLQASLFESTRVPRGDALPRQKFAGAAGPSAAQRPSRQGLDLSDAEEPREGTPASRLKASSCTTRVDAGADALFGDSFMNASDLEDFTSPIPKRSPPKAGSQQRRGLLSNLLASSTAPSVFLPSAQAPLSGTQSSSLQELPFSLATLEPRCESVSPKGYHTPKRTISIIDDTPKRTAMQRPEGARRPVTVQRPFPLSINRPPRSLPVGGRHEYKKGDSTTLW